MNFSVDWQPTVLGATLDPAAVIRGISPIGHLDRLLRGLIALSDLVYFAAFVAPDDNILVQSFKPNWFVSDLTGVGYQVPEVKKPKF